MRIHELAKELGVSSKELLETLEKMGVAGKSASSSVPEDLVPRLRASGGKVTKPAKPRQVMEPPPKPRPKVKPKPKGAPKVAAVPDAEPVPAEEPDAAPEPAAGAADAPATPTPLAAVPDAAAPAAPPAAPAGPILQVVRGSTPQIFAEKTNRSPADIVKILFMAGEMVTATTSLSDEALQTLGSELGYHVEIVGMEDELQAEELGEEFDETKLVPRSPVVTVMGHVDHGKTKLLDAIRTTDVVSGEFGGITQHIGAYQAHVNGREITFIDTPGHEAFTAMRARGAQITDIAVLVVAADDGVMPQTVEALDHAKAAGVPVVVAVNKIDKEEADPNRVRTQMVERGLVPSEWGGETEFVDVSAKTSANLEGLLETVLIVADLAELKGDPTGRARGTVLEAHLDKGRGPVATVLVQKGTLEVGDSLVCGITHCKVRAMVDENGQPVDVAGPAKPAQVLGWNGVPNVGDEFREVDDEREARHVASEREARVRSAEVVNQRPASLTELLRRQERQEIPELNLVVKADVQGSLGALTDAFLKLPQDEVRVNIVHSGAGAITEHDVDLAKTAAAIVVGFNVRPNANARELAEKEGVDIRLYRVIYDAIDDVKAALSGMLKPEERESIVGEAEVRQTFRVPRLGVIAGCYMTRGTIRRNSQVRLIRDGVVVYEGRVGSLRRFKDDVAEVREGFECGIGLENFQDVKEGDVIEAFEVEEVARQISS
ncbi:MAG: translation initiation factor [Actinomycetia bacterium]|jgi:translation initiation factor IF-2|nr:translation initiation factor [Actinomycetes bacterium]